MIFFPISVLKLIPMFRYCFKNSLRRWKIYISCKI